MEKLRNLFIKFLCKYPVLTIIVIIAIGYSLGRVSNNRIVFAGFSFNKIFTDIKLYVEVIYFIMASLLFPIAFFQFRSELGKQKRGAIEYSHKLYQYYTEEILIIDAKYSRSYLDSLSERDDIQDFNVLLNKLDTFAAAFIHGIADSNAGKLMMGKAYCGQVEKYLPTIKRISKDKNYQEGLGNIFDLLNQWK